MKPGHCAIPQSSDDVIKRSRWELLNPLIERVYVDMECSMIGAVVPVPAFRRLLEGDMSRAESSAVMLLSEDEAKG